VPDAGGQRVAVELIGVSPGDCARFGRATDFVVGGTEGKFEVVVKMVGLAGIGGNAVDVHAGEQGDGDWVQFDAGFFDHFAAGSIPDPLVLRFDMAARQKPSIQPAVVDKQNALAVGGQDKSGAGDVAGSELRARERLGGVLEEHQDQFLALERLAVGSVVVGADDRLNVLDSEHKLKKPDH